MKLIKKDEIDRVEVINVGSNPSIQVRRSVWVESDGEVVGGKVHHRHVLTPVTDLTGEDVIVTKIAATVFTKEVIADYKSMLDAQDA